MVSTLRIAVIADTHLRDGIDRLPDACLTTIAGADRVIHAGDLSTMAVLDGLGALGPPVDAVYGNVDEPAVRDELLERDVIHLGGLVIGLVHDAGPANGRLVRMRREFPQADIVVFGHSHMPLIERERGFAILNPGSPTQRRRAPVRSMGVITLDSSGPRLELIEIPAVAAEA